MTQRKLLIVSAALFIGACGGGNTDSSQSTTPTAGTASATTSASATPAATTTATTTAATATASAAPSTSASASTTPKSGTEGGMCGGIAAIPCATGLKCVMSGPMHPDKSGICQKP